MRRFYPHLQFIAYSNGNGNNHRVDGPAHIHMDGDEYWFLNDEMHREDGPAMIQADGTEKYVRNGELIYIIFPDGSVQEEF